MKRILVAGYAALALAAFAANAQKISELPASANLSGTEPIPTVQAGVTVATTPADILTYAAGTSATLTNKTISGASNTITNVPLSTGTTGTLALTRGGTGLTTAGDDTTLVSNGTIFVATAIPNCTDTSGNHLNYTTATNAFSCGTSIPVINLASGVTGTLGVANGGTNLTAATDDTVPTGNGTTWQAAAIPNCGSSTQALAYSTSTNTWSCQTVTGSGGSPGGSTTQVQYNNAGAFAGDAGFTYDAANDRIVIASGSATLGQIRNGDGGTATPSYTFAADPDNGMFLLGTNSIAWSTGGTQRMALDTTSLSMTNGAQIFLANSANPQLTTNSAINMTIRPGDSVGGSASNLTIEGGRNFTGGTLAGNATLRGGPSTVTGVDAGNVTVIGGTPTDSNGGTATLAGANGVGTNRNGGNVTIQGGTPTGSGTAGTVTVVTNGVNVARFDSSATAGQTRFLIYDVDNATLERVTVDVADSCGAGFKCLRIPN